MAEGKSAVVTIANAIKAFAAVALVVLAVWWISSGGGDTFRYRLTVAVESGGEVYTGSGVIQVKMHFQEYASPSAYPRVTGDAVVLEVPGHVPVFVLLRAKEDYDWDASIAFKMFQQRFPVPRKVRGDVETLAALREKAEIPAKWYPIMVAFGDINRPASVYEVYHNDLSRALGPDSQVVSMTIEMTDERVTYGVEKMLPWVADMGGYLDGAKLHRFGGSLPIR